jgi:hypothetical protein
MDNIGHTFMTRHMTKFIFHRREVMSKKLGKLFAQVCEDDQLRARLKADPKAVLTDYGIKVPDIDLEVLECTQETTYILLPPPGQENRLPPMEKLPESYGLDEVYQVLITKAAKDAGFRQLALSDPAAALSQIGLTIPAGHTVKIVEPPTTKSYLILPPEPKTSLSPEELDKVTGGAGTSNPQFMEFGYRSPAKTFYANGILVGDWR